MKLPAVSVYLFRFPAPSLRALLSAGMNRRVSLIDAVSIEPREVVPRARDVVAHDVRGASRLHPRCPSSSASLYGALPRLCRSASAFSTAPSRPKMRAIAALRSALPMSSDARAILPMICGSEIETSRPVEVSRLEAHVAERVSDRLRGRLQANHRGAQRGAGLLSP